MGEPNIDSGQAEVTAPLTQDRPPTIKECIDGAHGALQRYAGIDSGAVQRELALAHQALEEAEMRSARAVTMANGLFNGQVDIELMIRAQIEQDAQQAPPENRAQRRAKPPAKKPTAKRSAPKR